MVRPRIDRVDALGFETKTYRPVTHHARRRLLQIRIAGDCHIQQPLRRRPGFDLNQNTRLRLLVANVAKRR